MKSLLHALYNGDLSPSEARPPCGGDAKTLRKWLAEDLQSLVGSLPAKEAQRLTDHIEERHHLAALEEPDAFVFGFAHGARLMAEVFLTDLSVEGRSHI